MEGRINERKIFAVVVNILPQLYQYLVYRTSWEGKYVQETSYSSRLYV